MPQLPTLTVTDEQAQRLLAAFGSVENYKAWLKDALVMRVLDHERSVEERNRQLERQLEAEEFRKQISI